MLDPNEIDTHKKKSDLGYAVFGAFIVVCALWFIIGNVIVKHL